MKVSWKTFTGLVVVGLAVLYFTGPTPPHLNLDPVIPTIKGHHVNLETEIEKTEASNPDIKPDNQSRIIWKDSSRKEKTNYAFVYLHGFSATWKEGDPVHKHIARQFGANLYLPRLFAHGMNKAEPLLEFNAEDYLESAKQAIAVAKTLGNKVIIISTSTGGTLSLFLASENPDIAGLILYSPNIELFDKKSFVLTQPWGLQIARWVVNSNYYSFEASAEGQKYWNNKYRIEALIGLKNLLAYTMKPEVFKKVTQPVLLCYYYKNENEQDNVVSVDAMLKMYDELGTPPELKRKAAMPDVKAHAMATDFQSKDIAGLEKVTTEFLENVLKLKRDN